jgi:hypothetical protein
MNIYIKTADGVSNGLEVEPTDTILAVKEKIEILLGVPVEQQELIFASKTLNDDQTLQDYSIQKDSTINLVVTIKSIEISILVSDGRTFTITAFPTDLVSDLKTAIQSQENIPTDKQTLLLSGQELNDTATLQSQGIVQGSQLTLILQTAATTTTPVSSIAAPTTGGQPTSNSSFSELSIGFGVVIILVAICLIVTLITKKLFGRQDFKL